MCATAIQLECVQVAHIAVAQCNGYRRTEKAAWEYRQLITCSLGVSFTIVAHSLGLPASNRIAWCGRGERGESGKKGGGRSEGSVADTSQARGEVGASWRDARRAFQMFSSFSASATADHWYPRTSPINSIHVASSLLLKM